MDNSYIWRKFADGINCEERGKAPNVRGLWLCWHSYGLMQGVDLYCEDDESLEAAKYCLAFDRGHVDLEGGCHE